VGNQIQIVDGIAEGDRVFVDLPPGKSLENITVRQEQ
jgi:HlyD family secretion protein